MRSADLIVHYEVFYYGVAPHYEPHSSTSAGMINLLHSHIGLFCQNRWQVNVVIIFS